MIFTGDVALGPDGIKLNIPENLKKKNWFINLEGSLVDNGNNYRKIYGVFNDLNSIKTLKEHINISGASLANNHILDAEDIYVTKDNAKNINLAVVGAGLNINEASIPLETKDFIILAFGWKCIECRQALDKKQGVNPYTKEHVLKSVSQHLDKGKKVVCYFHWNYEFELYPQPVDRELAHQIIDLGVYAVIGAHAHRVQNIEVYKGRPIVYGLGNFLFSRKTFFNGSLDFGVRSELEIAVELCIDDDSFVIHEFKHSKEKNSVDYIRTIPYNDIKEGNAPFSNFTANQYICFVKKNRIHRNKFLPLFYYNDSLLSNRLKSSFVTFRGLMINLVVKLGLKSQKR